MSSCIYFLLLCLCSLFISNFTRSPHLRNYFNNAGHLYKAPFSLKYVSYNSIKNILLYNFISKWRNAVWVLEESLITIIPPIILPPSPVFPCSAQLLSQAAAFCCPAAALLVCQAERWRSPVRLLSLSLSLSLSRCLCLFCSPGSALPELGICEYFLINLSQ